MDEYLNQIVYGQYLDPPIMFSLLIVVAVPIIMITPFVILLGIWRAWDWLKLRLGKLWIFYGL